MTPAQIEQEIIEWFSKLNDVTGPPSEVAIEAIAMFKRGLSKNGYVLYQP